MKDIEVKRINKTTNNPEMLILSPSSVNKSPKTGVLWLHGGGYVTGFKEMVYFSRARTLAVQYNSVVIAPDYRLAPKFPFPAALEDSYKSLQYMKNHAGDLGINPSQLVVGGESAGGGLTIATSLIARDTGDINIAFQTPLYPMICDVDTPSSKCNFSLPWNTLTNHFSWKSYLRNNTDISKYAAPSREKDYTNLPPTYTFVGIREPFFCETLDFALNLKKASVPVEIDVYNTSFHAFDMLLPWIKISRKAAQRFNQYFRQAQELFFAPQ